jgi:hypothetical protein
VALGTTGAIDWAASLPAAGTYYVNFDTALSASIDGLNENFLITLTPTGGNFRFKTTSTTNLTFAAAKLSVAGSYAPVPEPASVFALGAAGVAMLLRRR